MLVEDDVDWARGIECYVNKESDMNIVVSTSNGREAIELVNDYNVDIVLMDIMLANTLQGLEATKTITEDSRAKVIMLTSFEEDHIVFDAYQAGAIDYIMKSKYEDIPQAVRAAYRNESPIRPYVAEKVRRELCRLRELEKLNEAEKIKSTLTCTELKILQMIAEGYTQKQISEELVVAHRTVKVHVNNILRKAKEKNSKELAIKAQQLGVFND